MTSLAALRSSACASTSSPALARPSLPHPVVVGGRAQPACRRAYLLGPTQDGTQVRFSGRPRLVASKAFLGGLFGCVRACVEPSGHTTSRAGPGCAKTPLAVAAFGDKSLHPNAIPAGKQLHRPPRWLKSRWRTTSGRTWWVGGCVGRTASAATCGHQACAWNHFRCIASSPWRPSYRVPKTGQQQQQQHITHNVIIHRPA